jgi:hypothetical protein
LNYRFHLFLSKLRKGGFCFIDRRFEFSTFFKAAHMAVHLLLKARKERLPLFFAFHVCAFVAATTVIAATIAI